MPESKTCELCGQEYERPAGYSHRQWDGRRFCGRKCSSKVPQERPVSSGHCEACGEHSSPLRKGKCVPCYYRDRYEADREYHLGVRRAWRERNPDYYRAQWHREAAIERGRETRFGGLWQAVMERDAQTCQDCGLVSAPGRGEGKLCIHHVDGDRAHNAMENLVVLCNPCHARRHARQGDYFGSGRWGDREAA